MSDQCKTLIMNRVLVQDNGIIRNSQGHIIGHLVEGVDFNSKQLKQPKCAHKKTYTFCIDCNKTLE